MLAMVMSLKCFVCIFRSCISVLPVLMVCGVLMCVNKARHYLKRNALVNLYNSFIYPYLIYCIEAWGNATNCHLKQLYLIQKKAMTMTTFILKIKTSLGVYKRYIYVQI